MVNLYRLIVLWFLVAFAPAHAAFPPVQEPPTTGWGIRGQPDTGSSKLAAVTNFCTRVGAGSPVWSANMHGFMGAGWTCGQWNTKEVDVIPFDIPPEPPSCPANSTGVTSCTCDEGYFERENQCVKPDDRTPEQFCEDAAILWNSTLTPDRSGRVLGSYSAFSDGALVCHEISEGGPAKGCKHWFTGDLGFTDDQGQEHVNGFSVALGKGDSRAGSSLVCNPNVSDPPKADERPKGCENGYKGSVNGVDVCIEAWTGDTEGVDWSRVRDAEGNESDVKTTIKCKGDQCTIKEEKTTKNPDGTTTTTTTSTQQNVNRQGYCARNPQSSICGREEDKSGGSKGQGGGGGGGGGEGEGEGFCKENPDSPMCKEGTFGGSCMAGFQCDGDAIQCAIAKEQHARACKLFDDKSPESELYEAEKAKGRDRDVTADLPGNETVDVSGKLSSENLLGGAQCVSDLSLTVWGKAVSLPLSKICPFLEYLGWILVAVSSLSAFRIVSGTSRGS